MILQGRRDKNGGKEIDTKSEQSDCKLCEERFGRLSGSGHVAADITTVLAVLYSTHLRLLADSGLQTDLWIMGS